MFNRIKQDNVKTSINIELDSLRRKTVQKNREYLRHIIKTIIFFGRQGQALRGHNEKFDSLNQGNFKELLDFLCEYVPILNEISLKSAYTSASSQNELIELLSDNVRQQILTEVKNTPFSIIIDETPDVANHEQISFFLVIQLIIS